MVKVDTCTIYKKETLLSFAENERLEVNNKLDYSEDINIKIEYLPI